MSSKRIAILFFLFVFLLIGGVAFCDNPTTSKTFNLKHVVNVAQKYNFEFRNPASRNDVIDSVNLSSPGAHTIATLVIVFNTKITFTRIAVSFSDLLNTEDNTLYYPYSMDILKPNTSEVLVNTTETENGHGAGGATLYENKEFKKYSTDAWNTDEIADFRINLDEEDVFIGTYQGSITILITV